MTAGADYVPADDGVGAAVHGARGLANERIPDFASLDKAGALLASALDERAVLKEKLAACAKLSAGTTRQCLLDAKRCQEALSELERSRLEVGGEIVEHLDPKHGVCKMLHEYKAATSRILSLERAANYVAVLVEAEKLSKQARQEVEKAPKKAFVPFDRLQQLSALAQDGKLGELLADRSFRKAGESEEKHVCPHLSRILEQKVGSLRTNLKDSLVRKLKSALDQLGWPTPFSGGNVPPSDKLRNFRRAFTDLLLLHPSARNAVTSERILAVEVMLEPLIKRFRYHFMGKRLTNRLEKPEWYFSHMIANVRDHSPFIRGEVQSLLDESGLTKYVAQDEFICGLIGAIGAKLADDIPRLLRHPGFISHTMTEAYRFDEAIRNDYLYLDPAAGAEWPGTLEVLAGNQEVFDAFLRTEKEFALHKFAEIVEADDAWTIIDEEGGDDDDSRPTHSADRVCILVAAVTEKYPQVSRKAHRIRLFVSLQVAILERYCDAMQKIVDVHGRSGVALTEAASVRLCAVLCSALHVASVLKEWSEDVLFLELYRDMADAAKRFRTAEVDSIASSQSSFEVQLADVNAGEVGDDPIGEGRIFDDVIESLDDLALQTQKLLTKAIVGDLLSGLKPYGRIRSWSAADAFTPLPPLTPLSPFYGGSTCGPKAPADPLTSADLSPQICPALASHARLLRELRRHLPPRILPFVYKGAAAQVEDWLLRRIVLYGNQFSERGGRQFALDLWKGVFGVGKLWVRKPENYFRRVKDSAIIFSLPTLKPPQMQNMQRPPDAEPTLSHLTRVLSRDGGEENAKRVLADVFGVHHLSVKEAKDVAGRRMECDL